MNFKNLFRKLERNLSTIERSEDLEATLLLILRRLVDDFCDDLGLEGGRIYLREGNAYVLQREYPVRRAPEGFRIPDSYPPVRELLDLGYVLRDILDPGIDPEIERTVGVNTFAAIAVGERGQYLIAFSLRPLFDPEQVLYTLGTLRHVINLKVRQEQLEDRVAEVREIQLSLLPKAPPTFGDFDVWGSMLPAEEVGGDLYDFIAISPRSLGIAIADSSGHGLPAALQARDAIIGLRMGVEERLRITATLEKLNRVVSHSALASKFISVYYGELELNGTMVYCNAGHAPPLLLDPGRPAFQELSRGGLVLGPNPNALYERGYAMLDPGALLLAYTDGITEAEEPGGEAFGVDRLKQVLLSRRWDTARSVVEAVFQEVHRFSRVTTPDDDQTVVAVLRRRAN